MHVLQNLTMKYVNKHIPTTYILHRETVHMRWQGQSGHMYVHKMTR